VCSVEAPVECQGQRRHRRLQRLAAAEAQAAPPDAAREQHRRRRALRWDESRDVVAAAAAVKRAEVDDPAGAHAERAGPSACCKVAVDEPERGGREAERLAGTRVVEAVVAAGYSVRVASAEQPPHDVQGAL
jgi:hypothetical protein